MAETKDESTIENVDANEQVEEIIEEQEERAIDPNLQGIQLFYEKNKKMVQYGGGGLLVVIAAFVFWNFKYLPEKEAEAGNEIMWAQKFFDIDSFSIALNGNRMVYTADGQKPIMGFDAVADEYGMTKTGTLANYYAGICYLRLGKYEQAIERLEKYNLDDEMIAPMATGLIGDAYVEQNKVDEAIKYYLKAADMRVNNFTTPYFLKKASFAYELKSNYAEAVNMYERLEKEYGSTEIGKEADRHIARLKALGNL
ncbi:MAG: tetratricopeptide repeat protein [Bacteroidota bacterium]|nr:tetratricopeptide repeat protein [Bacteroidota bacterium]